MDNYCSLQRSAQWWNRMTFKQCMTDGPKRLKVQSRKFKLKSKRDSRIEVRKLRKIKKGLKNQLRQTKDQKEREILTARIHLMREHIESQREEAEANRIIKIVQQLKEKNRLYGRKIWEIKRKVTRATDTPHSVKTSNGELMESRQDILGAYLTHYQNLLRTKDGKTELEKTTETMVEKQFKALSMRETECHRNVITKEIVKKAIKMMRNKRAPDRRGWRAEWIQNGGEEIENSPVKLFIRMERENTTPIQWNQIIIRSIHKKGPKEDLANQRGIFLTNIVSKVYEKVKLLQNEENICNMSRMQYAGRKNRSPLDHVITLNAITEKQRSEKKPTYILFADAEKCFDKLWLEDGLLELHKLGWSEKDVIMMLFRLNHITNIIVKTPVGDTEDFTIMNIVKQGTTHGPIICCAETSQVNNSEEPVKYQILTG